MAETTAAWVDHWFDCVKRKQLAPSPLTVRLIEWLRHNVPPTGAAPQLLHGDYGLLNTVFENAVLRVSWIGSMRASVIPPRTSHCYAIASERAWTAIMLLLSTAKASARRSACIGWRYTDGLYCMKFIVPCENALELFA